MKKLIYSTILLLSTNVVYAGLIARTYTYSDGNTITANENNTNENTLYSEINGNLNSANISASGVATSNIAANAVTYSKLDSTLQSTFTFVNTLGTYRRPVLQWISVALIDIERNTGTANRTCITFPDEQRCVTEDTGSTTKYRRFDITATAQFTSGTEDSGLIGASEAVNTWYAIYAVKSLINSSNFVLVGTTVTPSSISANVATSGGNYSTLNSMFGTNSWVYIGSIPNGDNSAATGDIKNFVQAGATTLLDQAATTGNVPNGTGIRLATTATATSLTWSFHKSTGTTSVPVSATVFIFQVASTAGANVGTLIRDSGDTIGFGSMSGSGNSQDMYRFTSVSTSGIKMTPGSTSPAMDIFLVGFVDNVLDGGYLQQL